MNELGTNHIFDHDLSQFRDQPKSSEVYVCQCGGKPTMPCAECKLIDVIQDVSQ